MMRSYPIVSENSQFSSSRLNNPRLFVRYHNIQGLDGFSADEVFSTEQDGDPPIFPFVYCSMR